jgi:DNA-binding transcriptional ArsR family regulator
MSFSFFLNLGYLIDRMRIIYYNVIVDIFLSRLGVSIMRPSAHRILLSVLKEQDPKDPWVDIDQIIEKTDLSRSTVVRNLPSLLEAGLVVEYPRPRESKGLLRYFAHASKEIERIKPLNRTTRKVLGVVTGQNPENPWVDVQQIIEKTSLDRRTVVTNLTILLEAGLVIEYPRHRVNPGRSRYFADSLKEIKGIKPPLDRNTRRVLGVVTGKNTRNPWVSIRQIMEKTGLSDPTVYKSLTSLLEAGLVVEHPREIEGQQQRRQRRYFADPLKQIEGIEPEEQEDLEYVPQVSLSRQEAVLVDFLMALTKGYPWLKLEQIRGFDQPFRQNLQDIKCNQLSDLLESLIQEKLVRSKVEGQHKYYALTPEGIRSAQTVNKRV